MDDREQRIAELHQQIDTLKTALQLELDTDEQLQIYHHLNDCFSAYIPLVRQQMTSARASADEPLAERCVGDQ